MRSPAGPAPPDEARATAWLEAVDPGFEQARRALMRLLEEPAGPALAVKYREIVAAVMHAYRWSPALDRHLRRAVAAGATLREILEGFQTAAILGGMPILDFAVPYLMGLHADIGVGVDVVPPVGEALPRAPTGPVSKGMREWAFLDDFDPAFDRARRDITALIWTPAAPALPVSIRELVACVVLAYRAFPTLDGHLRRAVREGASLREAVEALEVASLPGGLPVLHFALPFVAALHEDLKSGAFR